MMTSKEKLDYLIDIKTNTFYKELTEDLEVLEILKKCLYMSEDYEMPYLVANSYKLNKEEILKIERWLNQ